MAYLTEQSVPPAVTLRHPFIRSSFIMRLTQRRFHDHFHIQSKSFSAVSNCASEQLPASDDLHIKQQFKKNRTCTTAVRCTGPLFS